MHFHSLMLKGRQKHFMSSIKYFFVFPLHYFSLLISSCLSKPLRICFLLGPHILGSILLMSIKYWRFYQILISSFLFLLFLCLLKKMLNNVSKQYFGFLDNDIVYNLQIVGNHIANIVLSYYRWLLNEIILPLFIYLHSPSVMFE